MRLTRSIYATGILTLLLAGPLGAQGDRRTLSGDRVAIYNLAGEARIERGSGATVEVEIRRGGAAGERLRVEAGDLRGVQTLRVIYPDDRIVYTRGRDGAGRSRTHLRVDDDGTFGHGWRDDDRGDRVEVATYGSGTEAWADLVVRVPPGKALDVKLAMGAVSVTNVEGDLSIDVHAATVTTRGTRGRLSLDTGSGEVSVTDAQGDVSLDTGSGEVTLQNVSGPELLIDSGSGSVTGAGLQVDRLRLDTGSGRVRLSGLRAPDATVDTGSGSVELDLVADVERLRVEAGSGRITIGVPESLGARLRAGTGSGGVEVDVPLQVTRQGRHRIEGQLGDGRGQLDIDSGSGGVRIRRTVAAAPAR